MIVKKRTVFMPRFLNIMSHYLLLAGLLAGSAAYGQSVKFKQFNIKLPSPFIKELKTTTNFYWIATANGLVRYSPQNKATLVFDRDDGLPDNFITSVAVSLDEKTIYVGTPQGLARIELPQKKVTTWDKTRRGTISDNRVQALLLDDGVLFVGTLFGVDRFDIAKQKWKTYTALEGLAGNDIQALAADGDIVWAGGADGISSYDKNEDFWISFDATNGLNSPLVTSLSVDSDALWVGTVGGGLNRFDKLGERFEPLTEDEGLVDDNVQVVIDDGTFLWVGTFNGISRMDKQTFIFTNFQSDAGLKEPSIIAGIVEGQRLLVGSDGAGIFETNKGLPQVQFSIQKTRYRKKGEISIYATVLSQQGISNVSLSYKKARELKNLWSKTGIDLEKKSGRDILVGTLETNKLQDDRYLLAIDVEDGDGKKNRSTGTIIIDNTKPKIDVFFRPPNEGEKVVSVTGRYFDLNLDTLRVKVGKRSLPAAQVNVNRQTKSFRFPYKVGSGEKITITAVDIGKNKATVTKEYVIDKTPPKVTVNPIDSSKLTSNIVDITGIVVDENIDQVIINPGNIPAQLTPLGTNRHEFAAKATIRREGKYTFQITAIDKAGRKGKGRAIVNFVSDETIIEVAEEKLKKFTLKSNVEISGNILGPDLKEFYVMVNENRVDIPRKGKTKAFDKKVKLKKGKNTLVLVGVLENGEKAEQTYEVESSGAKPQATIDAGSRSFSQRNVTIKGKFDKGIRKVFINNKKANMNYDDLTYEKKMTLKEGANTLKIKTVDELGKVRRQKEKVFYDTTDPSLYVRSLPEQTGIQDLKFRGRVRDVSGYKLSVFPAGRVEYQNGKRGDFEGRVKLSLGTNRVHFVVVDAAGNRSKRDFIIQYDPKYPKREVGAGAESEEEILALRREINSLKKKLKGARFKGPRGFVKSRLPKKPGLYLVPLVGKIKSYDMAAQIYLGNRSFGDLVASYNGKNPRQLRRVLVPSPQLFRMLNRSSNSALYEGLVRRSGTAYMRGRSQKNIEKRIAAYLVKRRKLLRVSEGQGYTLFKLKDGSGMLVGNGSNSFKRIKNSEKLDELLVASVSSKGLSFTRY